MFCQVYSTCDIDDEFFFFFLQVPDPNKTVEYKKGYVMRKSCMEPGRRKSQLHYMLLFLVCVI